MSTPLSGSRASDATMSAGDLARVAAEVLEASPFPALVLEVPTERIVAASASAARLIDPDGGMVVGRLLEDFTADRPTPGPDLFAGGRLNGFETFRVLRRSRGADLKVRMWIRSFDHQPSSEFVLVVVVADTALSGPRAPDWQEAPAVVGIAGADLRVERISGDAAQLFDRPVDDVLGTSLLALVADEDTATCLTALNEAAASQTGITVYLNLRAGVDGSSIRCEALLLPLQPAPGCAFVLLPMPAGTSVGHVSSDLSAILHRLGRGAEVAELARGIFRGISERHMPGVNRLTTRELEIVSRLLEGDRPPAIATKLFLSQSTVRNHLASVYGKLGITSQQELLTMMYHAQSAGGDR